MSRVSASNPPAAEAVAALTEFIGACERLLVLTGAGCSTGSGIPDYRDRDGEWKSASPIQFRDFVASDHMRRRYWARSTVGWPRFRRAQPNGAHEALAALEAGGHVATLVTQNVDRLHQRAGSRDVIDLHGRLDRVSCLDCGDDTPRDDFQQRLERRNPHWRFGEVPTTPDGDVDLGDADYASFDVPVCRLCGGVLKPSVVFFGETIPAATTRAANDALEAADGLLVVGSSLMVFSGFRFARRMAEKGLPVAAVNLGKTRADDLIDLKVAGDAAHVLTRVAGSVD